jgi:hypothetical protein
MKTIRNAKHRQQPRIDKPPVRYTFKNNPHRRHHPTTTRDAITLPFRKQEAAILPKGGDAEWSYHNIFLQDVLKSRTEEAGDETPELTYSDYLTLGLVWMHQQLEHHARHISTDRVWSNRNFRHFCSQVTMSSSNLPMTAAVIVK